jgi:hypothetical protein
MGVNRRNREMANRVTGSDTEVGGGVREGSSIAFNEDVPSLDAFPVT